MEREAIKKMYNVDENAKESTWPYIFKMEFVQRSFTVSARTQREFNEWVRALSLIVKMNKTGFSAADKNPYVFEDQQNGANGQASLMVSIDASTRQPMKLNQKLRDSNPVTNNDGE